MDVIKCGICYENKDILAYIKLDCGHKVCKICFPRIVQKVCPYCRRPFEDFSNNININNIDALLDTMSLNRYELNSQHYLELSLIDEERTQRRRMRRERRRERQSSLPIRIPRPRGITNNSPIDIFDFTDEDKLNPITSLPSPNNEDKNIDTESRRNSRSRRWQSSFFPHSL